MNFLTRLFGSITDPVKPRRYLKDVKPGERINIEWNRAQGGFCCPICISNDPESEMIFLEQHWGNYEETKREYEEAGKHIPFLEKDRILLHYSDIKLKNFNVLNPVEKYDSLTSEKAIEFLSNEIKSAVEKEEFERVIELQSKISQLIK